METVINSPSIQGPAWDIASEYPSLESKTFLDDLAEIDSSTLQIQKIIAGISSPMDRSLAGLNLSSTETEAVIENLQKISLIFERIWIVSYNLLSFVQCELSVDSKNDVAQKQSSVIHKKMSDFQTAYTPVDLYLTKCADDMFEKYLKSPATEPERFMWEQKRRTRDLTLAEKEEMTISQFRQHGLTAWGDVYDQVSGKVTVDMPSKGKVGLAEASGYLRDTDEQIRKEAWLGIQKAWEPHEETVAGVLNSLAGWRQEEYRKRSHKVSVHFLDKPLVDARIERATLDAMMDAIQQKIEVPRRGLRAMAKCLGKTKVDPWDLLAPSPRATKDMKIDYAQGISVVRKTFAEFDPQGGAEFIDAMVKNRWIEGRVLPNKRQGAFCTGFPKSKTPRVFQTYMGSLEDVSTLAHELGHAYHSWVMKDLPTMQMEYPMTLAETASIFAETALSDSMMQTGSAEVRFELSWSAVVDAIAFMLNIPSRFEFEKSFYEARPNGFVSPRELTELTDKAWRKWFGDELSQTESRYWMTKLHFSISTVSFYNFPYSFGYLFSLGIYSRRKELGDRFSQAYRDILRDTGRMTAEQVIQKHLGEDIRKPEFWLKSIAMVEEKIERLEKLLSTH